LNLNINKTVKQLDWGLIDYQKAWDRQETLFKSIVDVKINNKHQALNRPTQNYLVFCEHPHVYTLGKSGKPENLLLDEMGLNAHHAQYYKINRGGDITYHGPGQLVLYPIIDLENFFTDIHRYMRNLEEAVILTCKYFDIETTRIEGLTGVWINDTNPRKICAMGVKSSRWVTMHGLALNVRPDMSYFSHIVPCGIDDKAVTSMQQESSQSIAISEVKAVLFEKMIQVFDFSPEIN
jgi:lipoyl(octanoyl) transferase